MKRGLFLLVMFSLIFSCFGYCKADEELSSNLKVEAKSAILMESTTGEVLFRQNEHQRLPPASVTKMMVMLLAMEAIDSKKVKLTDMVTASAEACQMGGSQIWLEPGEKMTLSDLMKAICIVSANDASYAVAQFLAGSEENFVALMNRRCKELGMKNTHFVNTTGLTPDNGGEGNLTSAYDMAILARELLKHPNVLRWTGTWLDSLRDGKSYLRNTNNLVRFYTGCDGLKTGFTEQAGFCLVGTAQRDGVRMIAVVMNAKTSKIRSREISKLFNYGFSLFKSETIYPAGARLGKVRVLLGKRNSVNAVLPKGISVVMRRESTSQIKPEVILRTSVKAPLKAGTPIGEVHVKMDGKEIARADLVPEYPVESLGFFASWVKLTREFFGRLFTTSF